MRDDTGASLMEVVVALAILGSAGIATFGVASQVIQAVERAHAHELALSQANEFLEVVSLWSRSDLDRRLGEHRQGPYLLQVERSQPTLYLLVLRDSLGAELLRTTAYRPTVPGE